MATTPYRAKPPKGCIARRGDPLAGGLVGAWLFNEGAGPRAGDWAGGWSGTLTNFNNTSSSGWTHSPYGHAVRLDGSNDYISTGLSSASVGTPFTLAALVRFNNTGGTVQCVFGFGNSILIHVSSTDLRWQQDTGSYPYVQATTARSANVWYHVAVTSTGSGAGKTNLYLDGRQVGGGTDGGTLQTGTLQIGRQVGGASGARPWAGDIACLGVWRRALTPQQIRRLAADPFGPWRPRQLWPASALAPITGAFAASLAADTLAAAGVVAVSGGLSGSQADAFAAAGAAGVGGSLAGATGDTLTAAGAVVVNGELSATVSSGTLGSSGVVGVGDPVRVYRVRGDAARAFAVEGRAAASYPVQGDAARAFDVEGD